MRAHALVVALCSLIAAESALAGLGTAVEFYNPALRHYFITAYPEETAALDTGTNVKGWVRTGGQFTVFTDPAPGLQAVCRFFGTPSVGPNAHFYTADAAECAKVKTLPAWTFEAIAFYIPTTSNGDCGSNWPVYRRTSAHRYCYDGNRKRAPRRLDDSLAQRNDPPAPSAFGVNAFADDDPTVGGDPSCPRE